MGRARAVYRKRKRHLLSSPSPEGDQPCEFWKKLRVTQHGRQTDQVTQGWGQVRDNCGDGCGWRDAGSAMWVEGSI